MATPAFQAAAGLVLNVHPLSVGGGATSKAPTRCWRLPMHKSSPDPALLRLSAMTSGLSRR
eukprot:15436382-Alexandrium_andersonii.AAC.1